MRGEHRAATLDRGDETVGRPAVSDRANQRLDCLVPYRRWYLVVDSTVGDDLGIALGGRSENQHAGALLGLVEAWRVELTDGFLVRAPVFRCAGDDAKADERKLQHQGCDQENRELNQ